ncbi:hypothetical protein FIBSPDRAFT_1042473 [Athelia psychrophila]|uniref:Uncharacterized protein n=1 Tax=Athelia psychrophila TaxID=1759441 RepID=A0A166ME04_9AGAM|nr:hypothetical protein FIBSPDRAFT_1042473 [Fibularhizoctonia sp. CBS 109695]
MLAPKALFRPVEPTAPVATLVMIENSTHMMNGWPDLRDHHLPTLLGTMRIANPVVPIQVLWLISSSVAEDDDRDNNELPNVSFDHSESNKISVALIGRGVNLLTDTFKDQAAARHLIIVAASSPHAASTSEWQELAAQMQREKIFLHVVMNPAQDMQRINALFYDSLGRQNHLELVTWFPADTTMYRFRLAGTPLLSALAEGSLDFTRAMPTSLPNTPVIEPPPFFRNYTFPMGTVNTLQVPHLERSSPPPPPAAEFTRPSLVTRLQKIHGLTRKKKYGAQPAIEPFLREDRILAAPPSISSLTTPPVSPIAESRLPAKSKADRAKRLSSKGPLATSPTTSARPERRGSWFRRKRNTQSPAPDLASSPTAGSSQRLSSSPIPTALDFNAPTSSPVFSPWQGSWQKEATHHPNNMFPIYNQGPGPSSPSYITSSSATASYRSSASPPMPSSSSAGSPVINDLDKPFNISPEYEAAATARFHAIFNTSNPSRTDVPDFTSMSMNSSYLSDPRQAQYSTYPNVGLPPLPPLPPQPNNSYFGMARQHEYSVDPQSTFTPYQAYDYDAVGAATSSLEGWDGQFPL